MKNIAIIFAAGSGKRINNSAYAVPKQFLNIYGKPIIMYTLEQFQHHPLIDEIFIAVHPDYLDKMQEYVKYYNIAKTAGIIKGGKTAQESIYLLLKEAQISNHPDSLVLIHDGVRPNITQEVISKNIECACKYGNAITCRPCYETVLISNDGINPLQVPFRKNTFTAQAPQTFRLGERVEAHEIIRKSNPSYENLVDNCTIFNVLNKQTYMVEGNLGNIKITTPEDMYLLRALINYKEDLEAFGFAGKNQETL